MGKTSYEQNANGFISIENIPRDKNGDIMHSFHGNLGIQVAEDGRAWICIDGVAFIRFKRLTKGDLNGKDIRSPIFEDGEDHSDKEE